jgi:hypothetical protein
MRSNLDLFLERLPVESGGIDEPSPLGSPRALAPPVPGRAG